MTEGLLKKIYYDPSNPGSYGGVESLQRAIFEKKGSRANIKDVKNWLSAQDAYTLHKPVLGKFKTNRVFVKNMDEQWQADLVDMSNLSKDNKDMKFMLTCIDILSKYAWVRVLRNKTGVEVTDAFNSILKEGRVPKKLQTDQGKEFFNKNFQGLMKKHNIVHFATGTGQKASVCERFNRTLRNKMWKYFTAVNTRKYIDVVQELVHSYNHNYHSSIKMKPVEVDETNSFKVFKTLYGLFPSRVKKLRFKFKIGDVVRISRLKAHFEKGYEQNYTDEYFTISERIPRDPPVYKLHDADGEEITGTFYEPELQKIIVGKDKSFKIEKIIQERMQNRKKMCLVKWVGWPDKFNSWIPAKDIVNIVKE
uniref:Integrase catalytic domain-containing protein n=1 Tax=Astyanax mexicanus TaxID=7994 RepID=A0A3B1JVY7_ASTMX